MAASSPPGSCPHSRRPPFRLQPVSWTPDGRRFISRQLPRNRTAAVASPGSCPDTERPPLHLQAVAQKPIGRRGVSTRSARTPNGRRSASTRSARAPTGRRGEPGGAPGDEHARGQPSSHTTPTDSLGPIPDRSSGWFRQEGSVAVSVSLIHTQCAVLDDGVPGSTCSDG